MENFKKLLRVAKKFELKYIVAQQVAAQPADVEKTLSNAGLWNLSNEVSPLLETAKVPNEASVELKINVKPGGEVSFTALIEPANPKASQTLSLLLMKNFGRKMSEALKTGGTNIQNALVLNWLKF